MISTNDYLQTSISRIEQLKNQKKSKERRDREAQNKLDTRRKIIIGGLLCKYFPDVKRYCAQGSDADIAKEFAFIENILRLIANDKELLTRLKAEAAELILLR